MIGLVFLAFFCLAVLSSILSKTSRQGFVAPSSPAPKLVIQKGLSWTVDGNYTYVRGSVKNTGDAPARYFKVTVEYKNGKGEVVDTDYTNSTETVMPNAAKKFEVMHRNAPEFKTVSTFVDEVH
ncbi:MAG: FxLYD domain-containing protein [Elusimicrobiota bacterium]|jgi:hypothetical protein